ncbi:hypothetical protein ABIB25_005648 [Nakamurella sp. UYEF19]|uniref:hypothetical protein n=1 Tax=Nakamurella sp. UYEF19 TaxID=1756392 RepID=UPI003394FEE6
MSVVEMEHDYLVRGDSTSVEAWSRTRLTFQPAPNSWMKSFRDQIRSHLLAMTVPDGRILRAEYASAATGFCDVENVLLYNVGTSAMKHLTHTGVQVERRLSEVPAPDGVDPQVAAHHHRYTAVEPGKAPERWRPGPSLIELRNVRVHSVAKVAPVWAAIRRHADAPNRSAPTLGHFGVRIRVQAPLAAHHQNFAERVKVLLDAVISAAHSHNGAQLDDVVGRLVDAGVGSPDEMRGYLLDDRWAVLGKRPLLHPHGAGVQWNPADDLCVFAEVLLDENVHGDSDWRLSAEMFSLFPASVSGGESPPVEKVAVPADGAGERDLIAFALTFNAVDVLGSPDAVASLAAQTRSGWERDGRLPAEVTELRTSLYFEQRRHRHLETDLSLDHFVRALMRAIREGSNGFVTAVGDQP